MSIPSLSSTSPYLHIQNLNVSMGERVLIAHLNWEVHSGQAWCVIGKNGVGKSTLLKILAGLRGTPESHYRLNGQFLHQWPIHELAKLRSYLPQAKHDAFSYTVLECLLGARNPYQASRWLPTLHDSERDIHLANLWMERLDIQHLAGQNIQTLSGGERQRVAIASMMMQDAQMMLLDEPNSALDMAHQISLIHMLNAYRIHQNKTLIFTGHDLQMNFEMATHALLLMGDGRYLLGRKEDMMVSENLSRCLSCDIEVIQHNNRTYFLTNPHFETSAQPTA